MPTLSIVIPAFNEARTICSLLDRVLAVTFIEDVGKELLVVDDCSRDDTLAVVQEYARTHAASVIKILHHEVNRGKGAALHTGIAEATGDYLIVQDADLEYDPVDINLLLALMLKGEADVVYGSRFLGLDDSHSRFVGHRVGNRLLTAWSNLFTGFRLTDMETCYKLFKTPMIKSLPLREPRFGFEPEVTARLSRIPAIRVKEVAISYRGRSYEEGKKIGWKDAVRTLYCVIRYRLFK